MNIVLARLAQELDALDTEARTLLETYPESTLTQRPPDGGWSVAECWEHVAKTVTEYVPKLETTTNAGIRAGIRGDGPYSYGILGRVFLWVLEPPARVKVKAPAVFQPASSVAPAAALAAYLEAHRALRERLYAADGLDLGKVKATSPASDRLKFPLAVAFEAMAAHGRRHAWQARQILKKIQV
jgi:hypothetical protein